VEGPLRFRPLEGHDDTAGSMKFKDERPFASVDAAVKKLLEIANSLEADHAGRLQIGT
jgi:hypothetical protein